jgi:hypothetical protein
MRQPTPTLKTLRAWLLLSLWLPTLAFVAGVVCRYWGVMR